MGAKNEMPWRVIYAHISSNSCKNGVVTKQDAFFRFFSKKSKFQDAGGPGTVVSPIKSVEAHLDYFIFHQIMYNSKYCQNALFGYISFFLIC